MTAGENESLTTLRGAETVFLAESVAIVGASESAAEGWSKALFENLRNKFQGPVYLINPRHSNIWGEPCHSDFAHIGKCVDLALVVLSGPGLPAVLAEAAENGVKSAILYTGGLGPTGSDEEKIGVERVRALCAGPNGMRIVGPNSMGALSVARGGIFYPTPTIVSLPAGVAGVVSASGGALQHWLLRAAMRGLGASYAVSMGNEIDLGLSDYINFLVQDENTRVICTIVEGVRRPQEFARAAGRALVAGKPIVVLKVGRSQAAQRSVSSHTGALAGNDEVFDAVCERYGMFRVTSLDDMLEVALAFSSGRIPAGNGVGMVCHSGGIKGQFLDAIDNESLRIATLDPHTVKCLGTLGNFPVDNPLDGGTRLAYRAEEYGQVCRTFAQDPNVDVIAIQGRLPNSDAWPPHRVEDFNKLFDSISKPILTFERMAYNVDQQTSSTARMPFLQGIPATALAIRALVQYGARFRNKPVEPAAIEDRAPVLTPPPELGSRSAFLRESLCRDGLRFPWVRIVRDESEARAAAETMTFPVVVKLASEEVHKTELGAVRLGIRSTEELIEAIADIAESLRASGAQLSTTSFLVQEFVEGVEMIVGAREDLQFGPIIVVGFGGTLAEVMRDIAIRMLPIGREDVFEMLASLRGKTLLDDFRGRPARDIDSITTSVVAIGRTFLENRSWLGDLEVNPLIVGAVGEGARVVDLRFTARRA